MRGSNHVGMRQFNERIVLQANRHHGAIVKADLAHLTQLSTQIVIIVVGRLDDDGLPIKKTACLAKSVGFRCRCRLTCGGFWCGHSGRTAQARMAGGRLL